MYIIKDILKTSTQNGKEVFAHISHMMYGRNEGSFSVSHIYRKFVCCWHLTMQGMRTWPKLSNYRRSKKWYSINCSQDGHGYKTNIHTFIHSFYTLPWWYVFWKHKTNIEQFFFLHKLNGNTFWVYWQYTWYLKTLRYGSLAVLLSNFVGRH